MKKYLIIASFLVMAGLVAEAQSGLNIKDITSGKYAAESLGEVTMLAGGDTYAVLDNEGKKVVEYSLKTGNQTRILFDVSQTLRGKVDKISGYEMSPDGTRMLVWNKVKHIYRRSFTADYYIYNIQALSNPPYGVLTAVTLLLSATIISTSSDCSMIMQRRR